MKTFTPGQTIYIDVELNDPSGIQQVTVMFRMDANTVVEMSAQNVQSGKTTLTHSVTNESPPGTYRLSAFYATNLKGNRSDYTDISDTEFLIENEPVSTQGPRLLSATMR